MREIRREHSSSARFQTGSLASTSKRAVRYTAEVQCSYREVHYNITRCSRITKQRVRRSEPNVRKALFDSPF